MSDETCPSCFRPDCPTLRMRSDKLQNLAAFYDCRGATVELLTAKLADAERRLEQLDEILDAAVASEDAADFNRWVIELAEKRDAERAKMGAGS